MFLVYFRSESKRRKRYAVNQKFKAADLTEVYLRIYHLRLWNKMDLVSASDIQKEDFVYVHMEIRHFRVWIYAIEWKNGSDTLLEKVMKKVGLK